MPDRDPLQSLWQSAPDAPFAMSPDEVRSRATKLQRVVRARNWREYIAAGLVIAVFARVVFTAPAPLLQVAAVLICIAAVYVCWRLHQFARAASKAEMAAAGVSWADFYRGELQRQRDALASVPRWYLAPFVPGMLLFVISTGFSPPHLPLPARVLICLAGAAIVALSFGAVAWLNAHGAKALQREIDALDRQA